MSEGFLRNGRDDGLHAGLRQRPRVCFLGTKHARLGTIIGRGRSTGAQRPMSEPTHPTPNPHPHHHHPLPSTDMDAGPAFDGVEL